MKPYDKEELELMKSIETEGAFQLMISTKLAL